MDSSFTPILVAVITVIGSVIVALINKSGSRPSADDVTKTSSRANKPAKQQVKSKTSIIILVYSLVTLILMIVLSIQAASWSYGDELPWAYRFQYFVRAIYLLNFVLLIYLLVTNVRRRFKGPMDVVSFICSVILVLWHYYFFNGV